MHTYTYVHVCVCMSVYIYIYTYTCILPNETYYIIVIGIYMLVHIHVIHT